ncbi:MAG: hypothetical protein WC962_09600 [Phycisphaerae bacterium]|jgi:hypothetical protein
MKENENETEEQKAINEIVLRAQTLERLELELDEQYLLSEKAIQDYQDKFTEIEGIKGALIIATRKLNEIRRAQ